MDDIISDADLATYNLSREEMDKLKRLWKCSTDRDVLKKIIARSLVAAKKADDDRAKNSTRH